MMGNGRTVALSGNVVVMQSITPPSPIFFVNLLLCSSYLTYDSTFRVCHYKFFT